MNVDKSLLFWGMTIKLRLFLFYLRHFKTVIDTSQEPSKIREMHQKTLEATSRRIDFPPVQMHSVKDMKIMVRDDAQIPIRVYHPSPEQGLPLIVFYHGGGFVLRSIDSHDKACRRIAKACNSVVISVGYRLAPEHKFPTAVHDSYDAYLWAAKHHEQLGASDKLILMGDSAGGNLATVTCIQSRDNGAPPIIAQVLIYPTVDARLSHPSINKFGDGYFLTKKSIEWFVDHYKSAEEDIINPLMSPILTSDHSQLPPAYIATACYDPLLDEAKEYADKLVDAGNHVIYKEYKNAIHGMLNMPRIMKASTELVNDISHFLKSTSDS